MAVKIHNPNLEDEQTDEYPILTEEAFAQHQASRAEDASAPGLDHSVETLRQTLEDAERRWTRLEARLEFQDRAIRELRRLIGEHGEVASALEAIPELTEVFVETPETAVETPIPETRRDEPAPPNQALLERIAALEAYIEGRTERWREMEHELEAGRRRIAELEQELAQRVGRELDLEQRLHEESSRLRQLRDKLRHATRRIEASDRPLPADAFTEGRSEDGDWIALRGSKYRYLSEDTVD